MLGTSKSFSRLPLCQPAAAEERQRRKVRRARDAEPRVGGGHVALGAGDVGAPLEQSRIGRPTSMAGGFVGDVREPARGTPDAGWPVSTAIACSSASRCCRDERRLRLRRVEQRLFLRDVEP